MNLGPDCPVVRSGRTYVGRQGHDFIAGISAETVGAAGLCLHLVTIPPGGHGRAHLHAGHETALYVLSGAAVTRFGPSLRRRVTVRAGDFHYIPAGVPHLPLNASADEPFVAVLARTDPNEQESVVLLPELEEAPLADG
ncbi:MAG: cupin domain-containing protein [Chloroflexota bacterium]|nr:cupin domain-containing protein [Chloroflexota bacterium]